MSGLSFYVESEVCGCWAQGSSGPGVYSHAWTSYNRIKTMHEKGLNMKITVISVGKIKEKYFTAAIAEYAKRLSKYCKLEQVEVPDEKCPESLSEKEEIQVKDKEGERILAKIPDQAYVIALAIEGKQLTSEALSDHIEKLGVSGKSHIVFVIGGSLGLAEAVLKRANYKLSFSKMTFPHQLMKVVLLEQVYRAYRIARGEPYHK